MLAGSSRALVPSFWPGALLYTRYGTPLTDRLTASGQWKRKGTGSLSCRQASCSWYSAPPACGRRLRRS